MVIAVVACIAKVCGCWVSVRMGSPDNGGGFLEHSGFAAGRYGLKHRTSGLELWLQNTQMLTRGSSPAGFIQVSTRFADRWPPNSKP